MSHLPQRITIRISEPMARELRAQAESREQGVSELTREILCGWILTNMDNSSAPGTINDKAQWFAADAPLPKVKV